MYDKHSTDNYVKYNIILNAGIAVPRWHTVSYTFSSRNSSARKVPLRDDFQNVNPTSNEPVSSVAMGHCVYNI